MTPGIFKIEEGEKHVPHSPCTPSPHDDGNHFNYDLNKEKKALQNAVLLTQHQQEYHEKLAQIKGDKKVLTYPLSLADLEKLKVACGATFPIISAGPFDMLPEDLQEHFKLSDEFKEAWGTTVFYFLGHYSDHYVMVAHKALEKVAAQHQAEAAATGANFGPEAPARPNSQDKK